MQVANVRIGFALMLGLCLGFGVASLESCGGALCAPSCDLSTFQTKCVDGQFTHCQPSDPPCGGGRELTVMCPNGCDAAGTACAS